MEREGWETGMGRDGERGLGELGWRERVGKLGWGRDGERGLGELG